MKQPHLEAIEANHDTEIHMDRKSDFGMSAVLHRWKLKRRIILNSKLKYQSKEKFKETAEQEEIST